MKLNVKVLPLIALAAALGTASAHAQQDQPKPAKPSNGAQSAMMGGKMADRCRQMMAHMGEHEAQSGSTAMRQSMAQCPMMKGVAQ